MPQLPEDIIDRLTQMERRIQQLSTAVNTRPALNTVSGGTLEVGPATGSPVFKIGKWPGTDEYRMELRRQTGQLAISMYNGDGTATSLQPLRLYDKAEREIVSDDIGTGGLARPWLNMLPPQDTNTTRWPQTSLTTMTTIAMSYNVVWQPKMRLVMNTRASSGATGSVQVLVNGAQWGSTVAAGTDFVYEALISSDFGSVYGTQLKVEVQAQVTSASGTVYANPILMYGRQT
ncbi:hypothetical protein JHN63_24015 [Streptomyces sp. MBT65]|uniref:hypothetical protein n=1 Tax=Streptomyces sp. MBT65 TaxID=1488395 RepID=UPI00190D7768|nr:hypothetical protein [Streptomyces sp. MBT65]MBK3576816.1 hypothetical protein [Streptomyces sp. MBT65]